jgi:hypothetical protein
VSAFTWAVIVLVGMIVVYVIGWHLGYRAQVHARRTVGEHFHSLGFGVRFPCTDERCPERRDEL